MSGEGDETFDLAAFKASMAAATEGLDLESFQKDMEELQEKMRALADKFGSDSSDYDSDDEGGDSNDPFIDMAQPSKVAELKAFSSYLANRSKVYVCGAQRTGKTQFFRGLMRSYDIPLGLYQEPKFPEEAKAIKAGKDLQEDLMSYLDESLPCIDDAEFCEEVANGTQFWDLLPEHVKDAITWFRDNYNDELVIIEKDKYNDECLPKVLMIWQEPLVQKYFEYALAAQLVPTFEPGHYPLIADAKRVFQRDFQPTVPEYYAAKLGGTSAAQMGQLICEIDKEKKEFLPVRTLTPEMAEEADGLAIFECPWAINERFKVIVGEPAVDNAQKHIVLLFDACGVYDLVKINSFQVQPRFGKQIEFLAELLQCEEAKGIPITIAITRLNDFEKKSKIFKIDDSYGEDYGHTEDTVEGVCAFLKRVILESFDEIDPTIPKPVEFIHVKDSFSQEVMDELQQPFLIPLVQGLLKKQYGL